MWSIVFRTELWTLMYCMSQASPNAIINYVDLPFYSSAWFLLSILIISHKNGVIYKKVLCNGNNSWKTKLAKTHLVNANGEDIHVRSTFHKSVWQKRALILQNNNVYTGNFSLCLIITSDFRFLNVWRSYVSGRTALHF